MDLTALATVQRECWKDNATDVIADLRCFFQNSLVVPIGLNRLVVMVLELLFRVTGNRDTCVLGFDEDRSSRRLDCLTEVGTEALVPTPPECRLIGDGIESERATSFLSAAGDS